MDIRIESLLEGASRATGAVAVIDVFRAFTTAAVAFARGARQIVMVGTVEEALALRRHGLGQVCMGEVGGRAPPGFEFGNSPFELSQADVTGKTIIQRTGAGTQGISRRNRPSGSMPPRRSRPAPRRGRCAPVPRIGSPWSRWATTPWSAPTRTSCAPSTCAISWRAGPARRRPCAGSSWPAAKSPTTAIPPARTCTQPIWTLPSRSTDLPVDI